MRATHLKIHNVMGICDANINLGQVTCFEGPNGTGKTSQLEALRTLFDKTSVKSLRNVNAIDDEPSEVVLYFDDGEIVASRDEKKVTVKRQVGDTAAMEKVSNGASFMQSLVKGGMSNPVAFLNCNDKMRVQMLLEALPVEFDYREFWKYIGLEETDFGAVLDGLHPLVEIAEHRKSIFDRRTGVNVSMRAKSASCDEIRLSVPKEIPDVEDIKGKQESLSVLRERHAAGVEKTNADARAKEQSVKAELDTSEKLAASEMETFREQVYREAEERIAAKKADSDRQLHDKRNEAQLQIGEIHIEKQGAIEVLDELRPQIEALTGEIATVKEQMRNAADIETRHWMANRFESEAEALKAESDQYTDALKRVDEYKANLVKDLPIAGLDIADGNITVDRVPWAMVNTAQRISIAVQVILLRYKDAEFKPVFVDGAEALDSTSLALLEKAILDNGAQGFVARVTDKQQIRRT